MPSLPELAAWLRLATTPGLSRGVARKLLIALWRYLDFGELPKGAKLKTLVSLS